MLSFALNYVLRKASLEFASLPRFTCSQRVTFFLSEWTGYRTQTAEVCHHNPSKSMANPRTLPIQTEDLRLTLDCEQR